METANDKILSTFKTKFEKNYGAGLVIPWAQILAALMSLLGGCVQPTPANIKAQAARPLMGIKLWRRLRAAGVPAEKCDEVIASTLATLKSSTDAEINDFVAASAETE